MKIGAIFLLFGAALYGADIKSDDTAEITSKVFDQELNGGKTHIHSESFHRGKTRVLMILRRTEAGVTKVTRSYKVGDIEVMESDENGDGTFETLILLNDKTKQMEGFARRPDGSVIPFDAKTLAATKEQFAAIAAFWDDPPDTDHFLESAKALKKKLSEAEKRKTETSR